MKPLGTSAVLNVIIFRKTPSYTFPTASQMMAKDRSIQIVYYRMMAFLQLKLK